MGLRDRPPWRRPEDAFTDEVARLARSMLGVRVERAGRLRLVLDMPEEPAKMFLGNIYPEVAPLKGTARVESLRNAILAVMPRQPEAWEEAAPRLLPAIRPPSWLAGAAQDRRPASEVLAPFLLMLTVIEQEHGITFVTPEDLARWGVEADIAKTAAVDNLQERGIALQASTDGLTVEVIHISSCLAVMGELAASRGEADGDFVALAASRDSLRFVATRDRPNLRNEMARALETYENPPGPSPPYVLNDGVLAPWEPPADDPCHPIVCKARGYLAGIEYRAQQGRLTELFHSLHEDVFVADFNVCEGPGEAVWSYAVWPLGIRTGLLPPADYVVVGDAQTRRRFWLRWDDATVLAPEALREDPGYYPPRWRVEGWPDDEVVERLQQAAVEPPGERGP